MGLSTIGKIINIWLSLVVAMAVIYFAISMGSVVFNDISNASAGIFHTDIATVIPGFLNMAFYIALLGIILFGIIAIMGVFFRNAPGESSETPEKDQGPRCEICKKKFKPKTDEDRLCSACKKN
jgi:hypothetical protein